MKKLRLVIIGLVAATLAVVVWLGLPAYRAHKEKRFAAIARDALAKRDYRKALLAAQQALAINSSNLVACRVMADMADDARSPHAIAFRRRMAQIAPTLENRIVLASCALRYEPPPFPLASQTLKEIAADNAAQTSVSFHVVAAQLALKQNRMAQAEAHFEQAIQLEPTNELHRLNLAVMRLESNDSAVSAKAEAELKRLKETEPWKVHALRALSVHSSARRKFADAEAYSNLLLQSTNAVFGDKLDHLSILHRANSAALNPFLETIQRQAATNVLAASGLVTRMANIGLADDAIVWVKSLPASMQNEMPLPMSVSDCYGKAGRWRDLESFLIARQWREQDFLRKGLLALAVRQQKETTVAAIYWNDAVGLASDRSEAIATLAQLASNWGWTNETELLLWRAARQFPREAWPAESLQRSYVRLRNTPRLFEVNTLLLERDPTNAVVQNNWATLAFLLRTNLTKAHQLAREVYERNTNHFGFVSTYAWSLHLQGRTAEGLKIIETLKPVELEDPAVASYYGVMLAASGQREKAQRYFARAETAPILPEELKLIADARKQL
jgi:tetratricopeptide (TPR) repeat protein